MEQFYDTAEDADYLIYNASIDSTVKTLDDLLAKDSMFADYKAVKEGNVWTTEKSMYQATDKIAQFTNDINLLVTGGDPDQDGILKKIILMEERMSEQKKYDRKREQFSIWKTFRRRSRYAAVFLVLILAFAAITC